MVWSLKASDLSRDPRCALHSAVADPDSGEGELKLYGRAIEASDRIRTGCQEGWWVGRPPDTATVFALNIEHAAFISWDTKQGQMTARTWSSERGYTETRRTYP
jgi:hypothetical protein